MNECLTAQGFSVCCFTISVQDSSFSVLTLWVVLGDTKGMRPVVSVTPCSRNLYQKLAPNRTQLYSVQVSCTRNIRTQHTAPHDFGYVPLCKFLLQISCTSFLSVCHLHNENLLLPSLKSFQLGPELTWTKSGKSMPVSQKRKV